MDFASKIKRDGPFLVVMGSGEAQFRRSLSGVDDVVVAVNAAGSLKNFRAIANGRNRFTCTELQTISGVNYNRLNRWIATGLLPPEGKVDSGRERLFGEREAFLAGLLGSLCRANQTTPTFAAVVALFGGNTAAEPEHATAELATAE